MSMQIKSITLYNKEGQTRSLCFNELGRLKIIAGTSYTGKSDIIPIIDYCLGNSELLVSDTVANAVMFYAVIYQINEIQVLIAKPAPLKGKRRQNLAYYEESHQILPPEDPFSLELNADDDSIVERLSHLIGIKPNDAGFSIRDATCFLFQEKNLINNRHVASSKNKEIKIPHPRTNTEYLVIKIKGM